MITTSSSIITDGLILNIDASSLKSYKGPVSQNVLTVIAPGSISDNGSTYRAFSGTENVYIPSYGHVKDCVYVDWYNDYGGGSGNCCPNMYYYGSPALTANTVYTYGILYRSVNRYTNGNLMYHYEYGPSGYLTEFGVHNAGYSWQETDLGNGWYWSRAKFTTNSSTTYGNFYSFMYQYATWNRMYVAAVALMPGDYTNLHPKYWPALGTSRANTSNLVDLTGNNALTANSLTYANDGTFKFNGSSSTVTSPTVTFDLTAGVSMEMWFKSTDIQSRSQGYMSFGSSPKYINFYSSGNALRWETYPSIGTSGGAFYGPASMVNNTWYHAIGTYSNDGSAKLYINGVLVNSTTHTAGVYGNVTAPISIGEYAGYFSGTMSVSKIYNRALSADEVKQNFNALRGRYGI